MANINQTNAAPPALTIPKGYSMYPEVGKISSLFAANEHKLYHKVNANDYDNGSLLFGATQPYVYRYPDELPTSFQKSGNRWLTLGQGVNDLVRITKFMASGRGLTFVGRQTFLQGFQAFDETNLYNPTEVIIASTADLGGGFLTKPKRHIDKSGGLLGGLAALIGVSVSRGSPPPSTVAYNRESEALPVASYGDGAGLLRGKTAGKASSILQAKWGMSPTSGGGSKTTLDYIKGIAKSIFPQFSKSNRQTADKRADENTYNWMVDYYNKYTAQGQQPYTERSGISVGFLGIGLKKYTTADTIATGLSRSHKQKYFNAGDNTSVMYEQDDAKANVIFQLRDSSLGDEITKLQDPTRIYDDTKTRKREPGEIRVYRSIIQEAYKKYAKLGEGVSSRKLTDDGFYVKTYDEANNPALKSGFKNLKASEINTKLPSNNTKLNKEEYSPQIAEFNAKLRKVISDITNSDVYTTDIINRNSRVLSTGNATRQGYDRLHSLTNKSSKRPDLMEDSYFGGSTRTLDKKINPSKNYGFAGQGEPDRINTLTVLPRDRSVKNNLVAGYTEWKPYEDDLIAFFFYDVVNERYIPFRCTVKNISEANNAIWEELRFMGRADSLYSYTGFTRLLSFEFTVVVNSLLELSPVWNRLNYLAGAVKPSGYTQRTQDSGVQNRFIIPPMFMITIGDLYKQQPIIITSVNFNIPEDAIWETTPTNSTEDWSYLAGIIKSDKVKQAHIGQVPREISISISCNLLEKERPVIGGNHFALPTAVNKLERFTENSPSRIDGYYAEPLNFPMTDDGPVSLGGFRIDSLDFPMTNDPARR